MVNESGESGTPWGCDTTQCVELRVRVTPRAGKNALTGQRSGMLTLGVRAAPAEGAANAAVVQTLAELSGVAKGRRSVVCGGKIREKAMLIAGTSLAQVRAALEKQAPALALRSEKTLS